MLIEIDSYEEFLRFLGRLKYPQRVTFEKIQWSLANENIPYLNRVHEKLKEIGFSGDLLETTQDVSMRMMSFRSNIFRLTEKISYLSNLPLQNLWKFCDQIGSLKLQNPKHLYLLSEIQIPVDTLYLGSDKAIDGFLLSDIEVSQSVLESVHTVCLNILSIPKEFCQQLVTRVEGVIEIFQQSE